ncbi:sensor histidine kinase [Deinococcus cellulosilyticus]|uniref:histidine kinase n=1 Tax=Deinococcus cellulosilyticus (strain DSM 18568 / NBRC 106333 / KACC 11606 / 5516J-15) TaxID=1223518 RepID=A0A511N303_DEIC1|nr:HAMP domain-containing sensor histidine kinase [Deinococcus cellulosilyticus]GEM46828.1 hypothetical protein DC3_24630 [Deinococcus cellulosilyticus NBRC 106333 = KACC 11606]
MLIRERLSLWYGGLCGLLLLALSLLAYGFYVKSQYQDVDRVLILTGNHVAAGIRAADRSYVLDADSNGVAIRLYFPDGRLRQASESGQDLPATDPTLPLERPTRPLMPLWIRLLPTLDSPVPLPDHAAFGTVRIEGERWRRYVVRLERQGKVAGYLETLSPLGHLDTATQALLRVLLTLTVVLAVVAAVLAWMVAGMALRPITRLTRTADHIAHSQDLSQRVERFPLRDELGILARTLNHMIESLEQAVRAQRHFFADASHELRTPITIVRGNLELIRRYPTMLPHEREDILHDAELEMSRLGRLVEDLLILAKKDAGIELVHEKVNYSEVVLQAFRDAQQLRTGQDLQLESSDDLWVEGDPNRLKQLLLILLDNALVYTPAGGTVTVRTRLHNNEVLTEVEDTGMGIPAEDLPHIFDRFYRSATAKQQNPSGSGLGLTIARWLTEQHGGTIAAKSAGQSGTCISLILPVLGSGPQS